MIMNAVLAVALGLVLPISAFAAGGGGGGGGGASDFDPVLNPFGSKKNEQVQPTDPRNEQTKARKKKEKKDSTAKPEPAEEALLS